MSAFTIQVTDEILEDIAVEARRRRISRQRVIEERLKKPAQPTMWDLMKDLVIDDPNSPGDHSTNKKHMVGYGRNRPRR